MTIKNFTAADFNRVDSTRDRRRRVAARQEAPVPTSKPIDKSVQDEGEVPSGTVPEVLTWVGEDKERAEKALEKEQADAKPRKGLVSALEELLTEPDEDASEVDEEESEESDEILSSEDLDEE